MTNTEQALPNNFEFVIGSDTIPHTATRKGERYEIRWSDLSNPDLSYTQYSVNAVKSHVRGGDWIITSPKQEQPNIAILHVNESTPKDPFLSRIKAFTEATNSSVFIHDGIYEVYYNGVDAPAKAETDDGLEKLMDAVVVLYEAT